MNSEINARIANLALKRAVCGYTWNDIADQINNEFGINLSADACRKRANNYRIDSTIYQSELDYTIDTKLDDNEELESSDDSELDDYDMLIQLKDERSQATALFRRMSRENSLKSLAKEAVAEVVKVKPFVSKDKIYNTNTINEALLLISDWHYGIEINNYMNIYNPEICEQRVNELTNMIINKIKFYDISKLHVLNLGDMIAGMIHLQLRINSRLDVLTQAMKVSEIIATMLYELSKYTDIEYYQVLDNHSRLDPNKKEAMNLESLARITPWWLKERFNTIQTKYHTININDNEFDQDISTFYINNEFLVVGVHGDKDKPKDIIKNLKTFVDNDIDLICSAHLHHASINEHDRTLHISNGSLMGTDDFAFQLRLNSMPSQTLVTFKDTEVGTDIDGIFKLNSYIYS